MGDMKSDMGGAANVVGLMAAVAPRSSPTSRCTASSARPRTCPTATPTAPATCSARSTARRSRSSTPTPRAAWSSPTRSPTRARSSPIYIIDNATLTGACVVALGNSCSGFYATPRRARRSASTTAAKAAGEQCWRMPLLEDLARPAQERHRRPQAHRRPLRRLDHRRAVPARVRRRRRRGSTATSRARSLADSATASTPRAAPATACSRSCASSSAGPRSANPAARPPCAHGAASSQEVTGPKGPKAPRPNSFWFSEAAVSAAKSV